MLVARGSWAANTNFQARLRVSGTDEASGSNFYTRQFLRANGTTRDGGRATANFWQIGTPTNTQRLGYVVNVYGPALAQPSAMRSVGAEDNSGALIIDVAATHSQSVAYDGITLFNSSSINMTGSVAVYGLRG
jgi:hypothetical protein